MTARPLPLAAGRQQLVAAQQALICAPTFSARKAFGAGGLGRVTAVTSRTVSRRQQARDLLFLCRIKNSIGGTAN